MEITIDTAGVDQMLSRVGSRLTPELIVPTMRRIGLVLEGYIRRDQLSGQALQVRTGQGRRSIFHRVVVGDHDVSVVVGADLSTARYMRVQEHGGTITPTKSRFLTIPLDAAKTGKGVARFTARELFNNPSALGFQSAFVAKGVIFGVKGRQRSVGGKRRSVLGLGEIVPLFALKRSITLKPVGYLAATQRTQMPWVLDQFDEGVRRYVTEAQA